VKGEKYFHILYISYSNDVNRLVTATQLLIFISVSQDFLKIIFQFSLYFNFQKVFFFFNVLFGMPENLT